MIISLYSDRYLKDKILLQILSSLFAGAGKTIKINDNDNQVLDQLRTIAKGAIKQTYKILSKRIDQFGVAQAKYQS